MLLADLPPSDHNLVETDLKTYHTLWRAGFSGGHAIESLSRLVMDPTVLRDYISTTTPELQAAMGSNSLAAFWMSPRHDGRARGLCVRDAAFSVHGGVSVLSAGDAGNGTPMQHCQNASLLRGFVDHMVARFPVTIAAAPSNTLRITCVCLPEFLSLSLKISLFAVDFRCKLVPLFHTHPKFNA